VDALSGCVKNPIFAARSRRKEPPAQMNLYKSFTCAISTLGSGYATEFFHELPVWSSGFFRSLATEGGTLRALAKSNFQKGRDALRRVHGCAQRSPTR
jgi:hypothetical protein